MDKVEEIEFNLDFHTALNLMEGMSYEEAVKQAHIDIKEMAE